MGIAMIGNNFGGLTVPPSRSPPCVRLVAGGVCRPRAIAIFIALMALLLVHEHPARDAFPEEEYRGPSPARPVSVETALTGWTVRQALRARSFYAMTLAFMMASFTYSTILPHVSAHLAAEGMADKGVYLALGLVATGGMLGKLVFGYLAERITARTAMVICLSGQIVFILLMVMYPTSPLVWVSVPLFGLFMGAYGTLTPLIVQENFGLLHFGSISGLASLATVVPFLAGAVAGRGLFPALGQLRALLCCCGGPVCRWNWHAYPGGRPSTAGGRWRVELIMSF